MLGGMAASAPKRPVIPPVSPGAAIAARRTYLGLSQQDVVTMSRGIINLKLLSKLENDHVNPSTLRLAKYQTLLEVLRWTPAEFEEATGVTPAVSDLPGAAPYRPTVEIPLVGTVSAGLRDVEEMVEYSESIPLDPQSKVLRHAREEDLVAVLVNGDSMMSDAAARAIAPGSHIIVEVGAAPRDGNLVVAWLPQRDIAVVKQYREGSDTILRSFNPGGPVFRLGEEPIEIRGVVRMIQSYPA